jgi:hypothetical protein
MHAIHLICAQHMHPLYSWPCLSSGTVFFHEVYYSVPTFHQILKYVVVENLHLISSKVPLLSLLESPMRFKNCFSVQTSFHNFHNLKTGLMFKSLWTQLWLQKTCAVLNWMIKFILDLLTCCQLISDTLVTGEYSQLTDTEHKSITQS